MSTTIDVPAKRWSGGWELWNGDQVWTQVDVLSRARQQIVDLLDTVDERIEHPDCDIDISPEVEGVSDALRARVAMRSAGRARRARPHWVFAEPRARGGSPSSPCANRRRRRSASSRGCWWPIRRSDAAFVVAHGLRPMAVLAVVLRGPGLGRESSVFDAIVLLQSLAVAVGRNAIGRRGVTAAAAE